LQFHRITFKNYKVYLGSHTIDCSTIDKHKPIVLIGGETGSGKTSLLEGIKLCLYGKNNSLLLKGYSSYNQFLSDVHNKKARSKKKGFSISLEYKMNEIREIDTYKVERSWTLKGNEYEEELNIYINDLPMESIDQSDFQNEINKIFPIGIGELLFFDSENFNKIPNFLENGFFSSLNKFMGIDLYNQLYDDLNSVKRHHIKINDSDLKKQLSEIDTENERNTELINTSEVEIKNLKIKISESNKSINQLTKRLQRQSGKLALKQNNIFKGKAEILNELNSLRNFKKLLYSDKIPFHNVKSLCSELLDQLEKEKKHKSNKILLSEIKKFKNKLFKDLDSDLSIASINKIDNKWQETIKSYSKRKKLIHDISDTEFQVVKYEINQIISTAGDELDNINRKLDKGNEKLRAFRKKERSVDSKGLGGRAFYEIIEHRKLQELYQENINKKKEKIISLKHNLTVLEKNKIILENKISLDKHELKKKELLEKTQLLLENFAEYLTDTRFQTLKNSFLNTLKSIATKKDLISDLIIDQKNKILKFVDKNGKKLNVKDFSAGESEIVAFSLLWAVNISSNKYYPIVTDSPFNRLDSDHRLNFIKNILKKSKHQFIFLSTNEEIGNIDDFGINNYVSKTYLIEYNKKSKTSSFKETYFGN